MRNSTWKKICTHEHFWNCETHRKWRATWSAQNEVRTTCRSFARGFVSVPRATARTFKLTAAYESMPYMTSTCFIALNHADLFQTNYFHSSLTIYDRNTAISNTTWTFDDTFFNEFEIKRWEYLIIVCRLLLVFNIVYLYN